MPSSVTKSWTINKVKLTSTWLDCGTFAYNGETRYATLRVSGFVNGEASSMTTSSFSASTYTLDKSTGSVDLKFSYKDAKDYSFVVSSINNSNYISGIASGDISTFKNYLSASGVTPTITTDASGVSYYFGETNKGTYNISVSAKSTLKNYSFSAQSKTFAITAQALETSWSSSTGNWSDTYNGQNSIITLTISGFVNGEKFTSSNFTSCGHKLYL